MNLTHTSVGPRASERYATHLPSGEMAGAISRAAAEVRRTTRENVGAADRRGARKRPAANRKGSPTLRQAASIHASGNPLRERATDQSLPASEWGSARRRVQRAHRRYRADASWRPSRDSGVEAAGWRAASCRAARSNPGSRSRIAAIVSDTVSPGNATRPVEHFVQHAAERPDVRALVDRLPARLFGAHVGGRAENHAFARRRRRSPSATASTSRVPTRSPADALARPKSSTLTTPSGVILMFAGFRSRWTIPSRAPRRARRRSARDRAALRRGQRTALRNPFGQRLALDQFEHQRAARRRASSTP